MPGGLNFPMSDPSTQPPSAAQEVSGAALFDPVLIEAATALVDNDLPVAERLLRARLKDRPTDIAAIRMMAELAARIGRYGDAENLLRRALELAPGFAAARANLATVLYKQNRPAEAIAVLDALPVDRAGEAGAMNLKAAALGRIGAYDEALGIYAAVLEKLPEQPRVWMSYGHILKTVGRQQESIAAYRRALAISPTLGELWWSLANLKTVRFDADDIAAMVRALETPELGEEDRIHLHFALGKAHGDEGDAAAAFAQYAEGNRLKRAGLPYSADETSAHVARARTLFTPAFFAARADAGCPSAAPVFILGLPRAGSTLIEQILSSHPAIEGTAELPDMPAIAAELGARDAWPAALAGKSRDALAAMGADYLERTRIRRKTDRPMFIDKLPNNWAHIGLIHAILPKAAIIDARRHPLDCCFSNFRQYFARGQAFTYAQEDIGRYYRDYVALMAHIDAVLPGRVHRVLHEDMIADTEGTVRRLLACLGLPFDPACLRFHENARAVGTASSEQVRRPINRDGMDQWRPYARWLDPMRAALGPVLDHYPQVPPDLS